MRKQIALIAAIAAMFALMSFGARAVPIAPLKGAAKSDTVIHVSGGCGPRRHRGPHGLCRPGP